MRSFANLLRVLLLAMLLPAAPLVAAAPVAGSAAPPAPTNVVVSSSAAVSANGVAPGDPTGTAEYRLGAGDLLKINIYGYPDMTADVRVDEAGSISYAYVGQLAVGGRSARDVESLVAERLTAGGFIRSAQVSVLVADYRSQKVAVMGQVGRPGQYPLRKASSVLDLLAEAGGVSNATAADEATLLRGDGSKRAIDLFALFDGDPEQNPAVAAGDTIYVPRASQFYVYGEVQRPGTYKLERNMTVSQAISAGGGLTPRGTERRATVKRRSEQGKETKVSVKGSDLLLPDDVLVIKESLF